MSRAVNLLVRFLFRMPVKDASGAYRCYRVSKLREAHLERTKSRGYSFQQEVLFRCHKAGCKLGEYCGDGVVQPDYEDCDDGVNIGKPCPPGCKRLIVN